jgi:hypothetical protein
MANPAEQKLSPYQHAVIKCDLALEADPFEVALVDHQLHEVFAAGMTDQAVTPEVLCRDLIERSQRAINRALTLDNAPALGHFEAVLKGHQKLQRLTVVPQTASPRRGRPPGRGSNTYNLGSTSMAKGAKAKGQ